MMTPSRSLLAVLVLASGLVACDGGPSAVARLNTVGEIAEPARARAPVPRIDGRPMWAASRQHSAQDNAAYQFRRNGRDFGSATEDDYVRAAHAFISSPPAGAQTLSRPNGDRLIYDPAGNVFAVATSDGAPRTLFRPRTGAAYWSAQQARAARDQTRTASDREG